MSEYLHLTTPEQSEQLMELGIPSITADFYYDKNDVRLGFIYPYFIPEGKAFEENQYSTDFYIPCWSLGQLMEAYEKITEANLIQFSNFEGLSYVESMIQKLTELKEKWGFDISWCLTN